jgi:protein TonB
MASSWIHRLLFWLVLGFSVAVHASLLAWVEIKKTKEPEKPKRVEPPIVLPIESGYCSIELQASVASIAGSKKPEPLPVEPPREKPPEPKPVPFEKFRPQLQDTRTASLSHLSMPPLANLPPVNPLDDRQPGLPQLDEAARPRSRDLPRLPSGSQPLVPLLSAEAARLEPLLPKLQETKSNSPERPELLTAPLPQLAAASELPIPLLSEPELPVPGKLPRLPVDPAQRFFPLPAPEAVQPEPAPRPPEKPEEPQPTPTANQGAVNSQPSPGSKPSTGAKVHPQKDPTNPAPIYPADLQRAGVEGRVVLLVRVGTNGRAVAASVHQSSGNGRLDQSALDTVQRYWRFIPGKEDGVPVEAEVLVPIRFFLR